MSPTLIPSPWSSQFDALIGSAESSLVICAPYIGGSPCRRIADGIGARGRSATIEVSVLTDLSLDNMLSGVTDVAAILSFRRALPLSQVRLLPSLHAKVYVADARGAIVTSSNLTDNGLLRNFEYGVLIQDKALVQAIRDDVVRYSLLGSPISDEQLDHFARITAELREVARAAQRSVKGRLRREFNRKLAEADVEILRARAAGRSTHRIFADAILHLLRRGPMRTVDLHTEIQMIHPDLCDDSVDRVIDGQHFGKRWKHGVRTAQVYSGVTYAPGHLSRKVHAVGAVVPG